MCFSALPEISKTCPTGKLRGCADDLVGSLDLRLLMFVCVQELQTATK